MSHTDPQDVRVLNRLNRARGAFGFCRLHRLPTGVRKDPGDCVYFRALQDIDPSMLVYSYHIEVDKGVAAALATALGTEVKRCDKPWQVNRRKVMLADTDVEYILGFDWGHKPHLIDWDAEARQLVEEMAAKDGGAEGQAKQLVGAGV